MSAMFWPAGGRAGEQEEPPWLCQPHGVFYSFFIEKVMLKTFRAYDYIVLRAGWEFVPFGHKIHIVTGANINPRLGVILKQVSVISIDIQRADVQNRAVFKTLWKKFFDSS